MNSSPEESGPLPGKAFSDCMDRLGLTSTDLIAASSGKKLTYKVILKARKGKVVSEKAQLKILEALTAARPDEAFDPATLFTQKKNRLGGWIRRIRRGHVGR